MNVVARNIHKTVAEAWEMKGKKNLKQIKSKQASAQLETSAVESVKSLVNPLLQLEIPCVILFTLYKITPVMI